MIKVAIKSEKLSPFGGFFSIMEQFDPKLSHQSHCGVRGIYKIRIFALWIRMSGFGPSAHAISAFQVLFKYFPSASYFDADEYRSYEGRTMAILNGIISKINGSAGNLSFKQTCGQTIISENGMVTTREYGQQQCHICLKKCTILPFYSPKNYFQRQYLWYSMFF